MRFNLIKYFTANSINFFVANPNSFPLLSPFTVRSSAIGHVAVIAIVDTERVDSGLPEDNAGSGGHSLATLAVTVDLR